MAEVFHAVAGSSPVDGGNVVAVGLGITASHVALNTVLNRVEPAAATTTQANDTKYVTTPSIVDYTSANELQSTIHRVVTYLFHDQ